MVISVMTTAESTPDSPAPCSSSHAPGVLLPQSSALAVPRELHDSSPLPSDSFRMYADAVTGLKGSVHLRTPKCNKKQRAVCSKEGRGLLVEEMAPSPESQVSYS